MGQSIAETAAVVMRVRKGLLGQRVPNDSHEAQTGSGAAGARFGVAVLGVVAVLVLLVLVVPQGLHVFDGELWSGVRRGQAGQLSVSLGQRLNRG